MNNHVSDASSSSSSIQPTGALTPEPGCVILTLNRFYRIPSAGSTDWEGDHYQNDFDMNNQVYEQPISWVCQYIYLNCVFPLYRKYHRHLNSVGIPASNHPNLIRALIYSVPWLEISLALQLATSI
jgi:hypothetical protein